MQRIVIHRNDEGKPVRICSGVLYVKEAGCWRLATKAEADTNFVLMEQAQFDSASMPIRITPPLPTEGANGDCIVLLYPLGSDGGFWDGEVWQGTC